MSFPLPCPHQTGVGVCFGPQQAAILLDTEGEKLKLSPLCYAFGNIHVFLFKINMDVRVSLRGPRLI